MHQAVLFRFSWFQGVLSTGSFWSDVKWCAKQTDCFGSSSLWIPTLSSLILYFSYTINVFFFQFCLSVCGSVVSGKYKSGGSLLERPVSSGIQTYDTNKTEWPLNEPMTKLDAGYQVWHLYWLLISLFEGKIVLENLDISDRTVCGLTNWQ